MAEKLLYPYLSQVFLERCHIMMLIIRQIYGFTPTFGGL